MTSFPPPFTHPLLLPVSIYLLRYSSRWFGPAADLPATPWASFPPAPHDPHLSPCLVPLASSLIFSDRIPTSDLCNYYSPYFIYLFICLVLLTELLWSNYQDTRHFGENNQQIVSIGARTQSFSHDLQPPLGLTHDMSSLSLCVSFTQHPFPAGILLCKVRPWIHSFFLRG